MRSYAALTWMAVRRTFAYRSAVLAGLATNFFFALLRAAVMVALFAGRPEMDGMPLMHAITFTALAQASIGFLALFGWYDIVQSVHTGQVGADLLKPMSFYGFWMAQDFGRAAVNLLLRGAPILVFFAFSYNLAHPAGAAQWVSAAAALLAAWGVSFAFRFLINLAAFWVPNAAGFCRLFFAISWMLSGFFIPLRFMPDWFERLCHLTPFPAMINTPVEIYLGLLDASQITAALIQQVAWWAALAIAGQVVLALGVRRLVVQGG